MTNPTGVFVRFPLNEEQRKKVTAEMMFAGTPIADAFKNAAVAIGRPVTGGEFDASPESMIEENEALEAKHLSQIGRPEYDNKDGWKMVGAFDTEDGEICLMYARPIQQEGVAP